MWTYVEDGRFGLLCSAVGWGILGVIYTVNAPFMYGLYGIELSNINALSMVRGVYGGASWESRRSGRWDSSRRAFARLRC